MRGLSLIIALFGVFAMLTLGASGAWASPAPMACHEMTGAPAASGHDKRAPAHPASPAKASMVMSCCIACVSPSAPALPQTLAAPDAPPAQPGRATLPHGRSPAPEHGPPRPSV